METRGHPRMNWGRICGQNKYIKCMANRCLFYKYLLYFFLITVTAGKDPRYSYGARNVATQQ